MICDCIIYSINKTIQTQIMNDFLTCPITHCQFTDPVIAEDGHTYERSAILEHMRRDNKSPIDRTTIITESGLRINWTIKQIIENGPEIMRQNTLNQQQHQNMNVNIQMPEVLYEENESAFMIESPKDNNKDSKRDPIDIIFVIDRSGSTGVSVSLKKSENSSEEHGFSVLDIIKHAVKTSIHSLSDTDRCALIFFDNNITYDMELTYADNIIKTSADNILKNINPGGTTDIYRGLVKAIDVLKTRRSEMRNSAIILLTDGRPNISPGRGEVVEFKRLLQRQDFNTVLNTYGFGNDLDSTLLSELAVAGNGSYSFIPDCSMVGTIMVNTLSALLCTYGFNAKLVLNTNGEDNNNVILRSFSNNHIGNLCYGQNRHIIIQTNVQCQNIKLVFFNNNRKYEITPTGTNLHSHNIDKQKSRIDLCEHIETSINYCECGNFDIIENLTNKYNETYSSQTQNEIIKNYMKDLNREIASGLSKQYFNTWGKHYLLSILFAHRLEYKNNFKDVSVSNYGGELFDEISDAINDKFNSLPPPEPTCARRDYYHRGNSSQQQAPRNMRTYNQLSNPCFAGHCEITLYGDVKKPLNKLSKYDKVKVIDTDTKLIYDASIVCIVKTLCRNGHAELSNIEKLQITPWHPIYYENKWIHPNKIYKGKCQLCKEVYSLVLDDQNRNHAVIIENIPCITMGHSHKFYPLEHNYYGSNKVIEDLKEMPGWDDGLITLKSGCMKTNENGEFVKLIYNGD